jgi:hypothetical protein
MRAYATIFAAGLFSPQTLAGQWFTAYARLGRLCALCAPSVLMSEHLQANNTYARIPQIFVFEPLCVASAYAVASCGKNQ